jgi:hypothetical protein
LKEKFLHFVWRFQLLHHFPLRTTDGQEIFVHQRGIWNEKDAGPDFSFAKIQIGNQTWFGNLEIHVNSSDWDLHKHSFDENYQNVILHVVYHHDKEIPFLMKKEIPTLELSHFIPSEIISNYENLVELNQNFIPCEKSVQLIKKETLNFWLERLVIERLERKTQEIEKEYLKSSKNWEEVLFKKMAYVFGLKVNAEAFEFWANSFDYSVLVKIQTNSDYVHALFLGQAGFLDIDSSDPFVQTLQKEYAFLKSKYQLNPMNVAAFKFFRLRPYSFPTVRLMQLATLYAEYQNVFAFLMGTKSLEKIEAIFEELVYPEFWRNHFKLDKEANRISSKRISKELIERIIINVVIPIKFVYARERGVDVSEELIELLRNLPPEQNSILNGFDKLGLQARNAFESQAYLELKKQFCDEKKCLNCAVGLEILNHV